MRSDRRVPYIMGAGGSVSFSVLSKGFGFWLAQSLGTVATTGPADTTVYTHTGTVGSLTGDFFTAQVGVPQVLGQPRRRHPRAVGQAQGRPRLARPRRRVEGIEGGVGEVQRGVERAHAKAPRGGGPVTAASVNPCLLF
jgi:hypothetical protein